MDVLQATRRNVMRPARQTRHAEIAKAVQARYVFALMELGESDAAPGVKARADAMLRLLQSDLKQPYLGHGKWLTTQIDAYLNKPAGAKPTVTKSKPSHPAAPSGRTFIMGAC